MVGTRRLFATASAVIGSQGLMAITAVVTARQLGPDGRGVVAAVTSWTMIIAWAATAGYPSALTVRVSEDRSTLGRTLGGSIVTAVLVGAVAATVAALTVPGLVAHLGHGARRDALLMMLTIPLAVLSESVFCANLALGRVRLFNVMKLLQPLLVLIACSVVVAAHQMTPGRYLVVVASASFVSFVTAGFALPWRSVALSLREFLADVRFGAKVHVGGLLNLANARLDLLVMSTFIGASQIGFYSTANNLMAPIMFASSGAAILIGPAAAQSRTLDADEAVRQVGRLAIRSLYLALPGCVAVMALAPFAVPLLFGSSFSGAVLPTLILAPGFVARSYASVISAGAVGLRRPWVPSLIEAVGLVVTAIALPIFLIEISGAVGAACASTLAYTGSAVAAWIVMRRTSVRRRVQPDVSVAARPATSR